MAALSYHAGIAHQETGSAETADINVGPFTIAGECAFTRVRVVGGIAFTWINEPPTTDQYNANRVTTCVQHGATGFTPAVITGAAGLEAGNLYGVGMVKPGPVEELWTSSATSDLNWGAARYPIDIDVKPMFSIGLVDWDWYWSIGVVVAFPAGAGYRLFASIRITYDTSI